MNGWYYTRWWTYWKIWTILRKLIALYTRNGVNDGMDSAPKLCVPYHLGLNDEFGTAYDAHLRKHRNASSTIVVTVINLPIFWYSQILHIWTQLMSSEPYSTIITNPAAPETMLDSKTNSLEILRIKNIWASLNVFATRVFTDMAAKCKENGRNVNLLSHRRDPPGKLMYNDRKLES